MNHLRQTEYVYAFIQLTSFQSVELVDSSFGAVRCLVLQSPTKWSQTNTRSAAALITWTCGLTRPMSSHIPSLSTLGFILPCHICSGLRFRIWIAGNSLANFLFSRYFLCNNKVKNAFQTTLWRYLIPHHHNLQINIHRLFISLLFLLSLLDDATFSVFFLISI